MNGLKIRKTISLSLGPRDWQLYALTGDFAAAKRLNRAVEKAVNTPGVTKRSTVRVTVANEWQALQEFGTTDTEPRGVLEDILDEIFGEPA